MYLSPDDLVFVPTKEEQENSALIDFSNMNQKQIAQIYKMISSSGTQCFFVRQEIATPIVNKFEFSPLNKMERAIDGAMIKEHCIKLKVDRLGNIKPA